MILVQSKKSAPSSRGKDPEDPEVARERCNPEVSEGCTAPSSRGETRDPEDSDGCAAPSSNGETNDPEDP